mgnify:CR=1 FL=1
MAVRTSILLICFLVSACANLPLQTTARAQQEPAPQPDPIYCYKTLGKINCYTQPLDGSEANRLVGFEGPAPRPNAGTGPLSP